MKPRKNKYKKKSKKKIIFKRNIEMLKQSEEYKDMRIAAHYKTVKSDYDYGLPHLMD